MKVVTFIDNYKRAFGNKAELPLAFWYSDLPITDPNKINGCFFKSIKTVREGIPVSFSLDTISCGGGKFYVGFINMPEHIPNFVSLKEKYKRTPELMLEFLNQLETPRASKEFLNFARIDKISTFKYIEGILFFATPDILSGLATWAYFDNNDDNAVSSIFGSGCSPTITQAAIENKINGRRTFVGFFDPSVRPHIEANILSFVIPMSRFSEMYYTMRESCLFDTHAWAKIRDRIDALS